ncbi:MFS transporter [Saccharopolyspora sp. NPDC003752]
MFRSVPYKWLVAIAFVFGLFMEILDMTVLNTALPALGRQFGVGTESLQWLVTGYLVSMAVFIPASGWVADRFGSKKTFLFALAVFTAASLWAGFAGSLAELVVARIVQGVGGGLLTPVGTAMLFRAFRRTNARRPRRSCRSRPASLRLWARCWADGWSTTSTGAGSS